VKFTALAVVIALASLACEQGTSAFQLEVGDCIDISGLSPWHYPVDRWTITVGAAAEGPARTIDCPTTYTPESWGEVIAVFELGDSTPLRSYPGYGVLFDQVLGQCPQESDILVFPTEESWNQGDREVACASVEFDLPPGPWW